MTNPDQLHALKLKDLDLKLASCQDSSNVIKPPTINSNLEQLMHALAKLQDASPRAQTRQQRGYFNTDSCTPQDVETEPNWCE